MAGGRGSVVIGGVGTLVVVGLWMAMFPTLRRRQRLHLDNAAQEQNAASQTV